MLTDREWFPEEKQSSLCGANGDPPIPGEELRNSSDGILRNIRFANPVALSRLHSFAGLRSSDPDRGSGIEYPITAQVLEVNDFFLRLDWVGGHELTIAKGLLAMGWSGVEVGDWIEAKVRIKSNGSVTKAVFIEKTTEPSVFSDQEAEEYLASLAPAELDPVDWLND
ncbi:MAG: hypothetical protein LW699_08620 [Pirellula sp.]|jgi:hypothetical protein|nr:hypothetical protein [Pirellula sp.]